MELDLVICDMAGTTVEDRGQVQEAFLAALDEHGLAVTAEELQAVRGASKRAAIRQLLLQGSSAADPERAEAVFTSFRDHLGGLYRTEGVHSIPGAADTFEWLRARGMRVALTTGFDRETTELLLSGLGWNGGTVDAVVCGDDVAQGRPAPYLIFRAMERIGSMSVRRVVVLGDTVLDLQAGENAGVALNIGVLSGAHGREQLEGAPHTHLLVSIADLPRLLQ